jgi:hypothetical protein
LLGHPPEDAEVAAIRDEVEAAGTLGESLDAARGHLDAGEAALAGAAGLDRAVVAELTSFSRTLLDRTS